MQVLNSEPKRIEEKFFLQTAVGSCFGHKGEMKELRHGPMEMSRRNGYLFEVVGLVCLLACGSAEKRIWGFRKAIKLRLQTGLKWKLKLLKLPMP